MLDMKVSSLPVYITLLLRPHSLTDSILVIEWDTSLHVEGTNLWTKCVLADGGHHCRQLCAIVDEPLIQGMLVGTATDELSSQEREKVRIAVVPPSPSHLLTLTAVTRLKKQNGPTKNVTSHNGCHPALTPSYSP
jgi:hypothetical protein